MRVSFCAHRWAPVVCGQIRSSTVGDCRSPHEVRRRSCAPPVLTVSLFVAEGFLKDEADVDILWAFTDRQLSCALHKLNVKPIIVHKSTRLGVWNSGNAWSRRHLRVRIALAVAAAPILLINWDTGGSRQGGDRSKIVRKDTAEEDKEELHRGHGCSGKFVHA